MKIPKVHATFQQVVLMGYFAWSILLITRCVLPADGATAGLPLRIVLYGVYLSTTIFLIFQYLLPPKEKTTQHSSTEPKASEALKNMTNNEESLSIGFLKDLMTISESGKTAHAKVLSVSEVGQYIDLHPFLKIHLQVREKGKEPFSMQAYTLVNKRLIPRIGDSCQIRYLPHKQKTVLIMGLGKLNTDMI